MILMLILASWIVALATVTALCAMARRGDAAQHSQQHDLQWSATHIEAGARTPSASESRRTAAPNLSPARARIRLDRRHARTHANTAARRPQAGWRRRAG
jgi:multidrug efflux pump subunit AcrB